MATARKQLVSLDATPYYHCVSRCVRSSFLCGFDSQTKTNFEHRRQWIEQKMLSLTRTYCVDICAYAIMSNHYHLVAHIDRPKAQTLSPIDVVERWSLNHKLPLLIEKWRRNQLTEKAETKAAEKLIEVWRERLWSLSWFMKELNYEIACRANQEDGCSGHFWESRFKSQALLDEKALFAAMTYVDLNPIRAGIASTPERSDYTSIKTRIDALKSKSSDSLLAEFTDTGPPNKNAVIPCELYDYLDLVDWAARARRQEKASMCASLPTLFSRLGFTYLEWLKVSNRFQSYRFTAIGRLERVKTAVKALSKTKMRILRLA